MTSLQRIFRAVTALATTAVLALSAQPALAQPFDSVSSLSGVDVASHQHPGGAPIAWDHVKSDGHSFAFVKASEGAGWTNDFFVDDANAAHAAGLSVGSYHYARPSGDPIAQARHYADQITRIAAHPLPPVLDLEVAEGKNPQELAAWTRDFLNEFKAQSGRQPMIYTYRYFWMHEMANTSEFSEYPLWLAAYQSKAPDPVGGWDVLDFWQRTGKGRVSGIGTDVDLNLYNGHQGQFEAFISGNYQASGGVFGDLGEIPALESLPDLGADASQLANSIINLLTGESAPAEVRHQVAELGLSAEAIEGVIGLVLQLIAEGELPVEQIRGIAEGDYSVGDLVILLDNAQHLVSVDPERGNLLGSSDLEAILANL
ncbi:glycoside hydrolase family 25 protein [Corynebacterium sp. ES2794-CONJ1]|uniref:glycoside hydrolase family 25 protein n=1 Tax=unclassified Corynebacterium TaxID=2624378 RepID=UPI002169AF2F|nr:MULTISPECIES: glycoside hydrolase family 25 protein [unclassified Corynebacterium]MCS4490719.1 glycoside hydrolase family 25 protein [Corynebacterium sp. ES2775-CONJ]MCS4532622.1 glycoside hydrolase family 25 protein [Corynebacterium sp. ES2730-CONJ]MCU9520017.1 glycoside hydrolase family 25 protein [Corynebacterium sp. ES2794-CONJ1]